MAETALKRFRIDSDQWDRFKAAVDNSPDPEADMSKVLRQFVRWYCRETGAKLPERPAEKA
jgi:uncharacterized protein (DUF1778 family)